MKKIIPIQNCEPQKCYPDSPCDYCSRMRDSTPELLEACKDVLREKTLHGNVVDSIRAVRKAIAKAEGREL